MEKEIDVEIKCPNCGYTFQLTTEEKNVGHPIEIDCINCHHKYRTTLGFVN